MSLRGPETKASVAAIPQDAEFVGIQFRLGAFMPQLPARSTRRRSIDCPMPDPVVLAGLLGLAIPRLRERRVFVDGSCARAAGARDRPAILGTHRTAVDTALDGLSRRAIGQIERASGPWSSSNKARHCRRSPRALATPTRRT